MSIIVYSLFFIGILIGISYLLGKLRIGRLGYWLLAIYSVILLASAVAYLFIPKETFIAETFIDNDLTWADMYQDITNRVVYEGEPLSEFEQYKAETWSFEIGDRKELALTAVGGAHFYSVIVERVATAETVDVTLYEVKPNFTLEHFGVERINVDLIDDELVIELPGALTIEVGQMMKEFPFTQFSKSETNDYHNYDIFSGEKVLYMTIPENIELVVRDDMFVEWLNE